MRTFAKIAFVLVLILAAFGAGAYLATMSPSSENLFISLKSQVRTALGLPKFWFPVPTKPGNPADVASACPDPKRTLVIVTGGQSNAANSNSRLSETRPGDNVFVWFDGRCYVARDPVAGASSAMGSLWPLLGLNLAKETGRPVLFINGAISGTQVADWLDPRSGYYDALAKRVAQAREAGYEAEIVLWHQGETDAATGTDTVALTRDIGNLTQKLLKDIPKSTLYLFRASKCIGDKRKNGVAAVIAAQEQAGKNNNRIVVGMNTDELDNDYRWDTCHFNSRARDRIVEQVGPEISRLIARKSNP
jgi:hypothetical protein